MGLVFVYTIGLNIGLVILCQIGVKSLPSMSLIIKVDNLLARVTFAESLLLMKGIGSFVDPWPFLERIQSPYAS